MQLAGTVSNVRGSCPDISFVINGTTVYADSATQYRAGNCRQVTEHLNIAVVGERQADGRVRALSIDMKPRG